MENLTEIPGNKVMKCCGADVAVAAATTAGRCYALFPGAFGLRIVRISMLS